MFFRAGGGGGGGVGGGGGGRGRATVIGENGEVLEAQVVVVFRVTPIRLAFHRKIHESELTDILCLIKHCLTIEYIKFRCRNM